ncbi:thermonuclease family protein [Ramlibacter rhizophilus]|uniref:Thermonuclease family protein n=1 Tax=Ramlibacter rhizophilus TaxID=1781167 RepID=A0A4Z0BJ04_9BURK|nr:thermonuclease family protein [Ramlibacter rhizophilus]TFY98114.1 thermonuclease family protein [Ramlibacter rhizophilus]
MRTRSLGLLLSLLLCLAGLQAQAATRTLRGTVSHVTDGDSLWLRPASGGAPQALRLRGIDAPEICQEHGPAARRALAALVEGRPVVVRLRGRDAYQRLLGELATASHGDVGAWMVAQGHAWAPSRSRSNRYAQAQARAQAERRGLWAQPHAVEPRVFRRRHGSCAR